METKLSDKKGYHVSTQYEWLLIKKSEPGFKWNEGNTQKEDNRNSVGVDYL